MKTLRLFLTAFGGLALTIGLTLVLFLFSSPNPLAQAGGTLRYVATSGSDSGNDCTDSGNPCRSIPHALFLANTGDTIQVGEGEFTGTLMIDKDLFLFGAGQDLTAIDGGGTSSVIQVSINSTSVISGISIINGHAYEGGGILNEGDLTLFQITLTGNKSDAVGGAIKNSGVLHLTNSLIFTNTASRGNIYNLGTVYITESTIKENLATMDGGGIINQFGAYMTITQSNIAQNTAKYGGGGIANNGNLTLLNSSIISNTSNGGSTADQGGGIENSGNLVVENTEISGNSAYEGYAIYQYNYPNPTTTLLNVSIAKNHPLPNTSTSPGNAGISVLGGNIVIQNSILVSGEVNNCYIMAPPSGTGSITSLGNNLSDDDSCGLTAASDLQNVAPKLDSFHTENLVWFHTLSMDSPAIDQGNNAVCPTLDIRGKTRPQDGNFDGTAQCDIGAYELILPSLYIVAPSVGQINTPLEIEARTTVLTLTTPITYHWSISELAPISHTSEYTDIILPQWSTAGQKVITVQATGNNGLQLIATKTIEIVHQVFLPLVIKPWAPQAGYWDTEYGYFIVTPDQKYVDNFSVFFDIPGCGNLRIYTTELVPIINNSFSFNNFTTYYASGTFDSETTAAGVFGLDDVYISPCNVRWTIPLTNWTASPVGTNTQMQYPSNELNILPEDSPYKVELLSNSK